jgi:hypothetical protein
MAEPEPGRPRDQHGRPIYHWDECPPAHAGLAVWRNHVTAELPTSKGGYVGGHPGGPCQGGWVESGDWWLHCAECRPQYLTAEPMSSSRYTTDVMATWGLPPFGPEIDQVLRDLGYVDQLEGRMRRMVVPVAGVMQGTDSYSLASPLTQLFTAARMSIIDWHRLEYTRRVADQG